MARGGRRPGAGRKPGSVTKKTASTAAKALASGLTPLDVLLRSMRELYDKQDYVAASLVAQRAAPYIHQRFAPTQEPAKVHPEQKLQRDLFDPPTPDATAPDTPDKWDRLLN